MPIDLTKLDNQLILHEGMRFTAYQDTRGFCSIGVGRNLDTNPLNAEEMTVCKVGYKRPTTISREGAMFCLHNDERRAMGSLDAHAPWWVDLDEVRARVMVDLCFNMGWRSADGKHGLSTFPHFLLDMQQGSFEVAAADLMDSVWYNEVKQRGPRLVGMVKTGQDYMT